METQMQEKRKRAQKTHSDVSSMYCAQTTQHLEWITHNAEE